MENKKEMVWSGMRTCATCGDCFTRPVHLHAPKPDMCSGCALDAELEQHRTEGNIDNGGRNGELPGLY